MKTYFVITMLVLAIAVVVLIPTLFSDYSRCTPLAPTITTTQPHTSDCSRSASPQTTTTTITTTQSSGDTSVACGASGPARLSGSGTFSSLDFGGTYPDNSDCGWVITVSSGQGVNLRFTRRGLGTTQNSIDNTVKVYEGDTASSNPIAVLHGSSFPAEVTSSTKQIYVQSDFFENMAGFQLFYSPTTTATTITQRPDDRSFRCGDAPLQSSCSRIVGGSEAAKHSWPWQISLRIWNETSSDKSNFHICGGTIISKRWILTAAHCVSSDVSTITPASELSVIAGIHQKAFSANEPYRQSRDVVRVISHNEYYVNRKDIALLELDQELEWTDYVQPACLPTSDVDDNTSCMITGWGDTKNTADNSVLQEAEVLIIPQSTCTSYYGSSVNQFMVCAGFEQGGVDACHGDSGGPLVCARNIDDAYILHGVTSWGRGCAEPKKPGVYARVSTLMGWIDQHTSSDYYTKYTSEIHQTENV